MQKRDLSLKPRLASGQSVGFAELGLRGSLRFLQTARAVSPRAMRWLLQWRKPRPEEVRELFEALGATYIKFGQFIASSPSVFPREYVDEFQKCLDQTPALPFGKIRKIIEQELDKPLKEVFAHIDTVPLASASIAQVHAARLLSGEDVVVKVQKPGVQAVLTTDMNAVYLATRVFELITPHLEKEAVAGVVAEMYQSMLDECDFRKEADNLIRFRHFLDSTDNKQVVVPAPYIQASGQRVLTMQRLYGIALTDPESLKSYQHDPAQCLFNALNTWFSSLTKCDFFHADLHSGNLMLLDDGRVGFIDFGMVGRIRPQIWEAMFALISGLEQGDYRKIAESLLTVGVTRDNVDLDALTRDVKRLFVGLNALDPAEALHISAGSGDGVTGMVNELGDIAKAHGIRFPRAFTLLLKQLLYFDRYMDLLAPGVSLFDSKDIQLL